MSVRLEITVDDGGLGAAMRRAAAELDDLKTPLEATGVLMEERFTSRFDEQHGPGGVPWVPSRRVKAEAVPRPGARKNRMGPLKPTSKTLIDSGSLRESITHAVQGKQVQIGVQNPSPGDAHKYARVHQFGAVITPKKGDYLVFEVAGVKIFATSVTIPARPFIGFDDQDTADMEDLWTDVLRSAFDGA